MKIAIFTATIFLFRPLAQFVDCLAQSDQASQGRSSTTAEVTPGGMSKSDRRTAPLFDDLGNHHHTITTRSPLAQRYFDQGLTLAYGFNHGEAIRSFKEAARLDPDCAMAH